MSKAVKKPEPVVAPRSFSKKKIVDSTVALQKLSMRYSDIRIARQNKMSAIAKQTFD